MFISIYAFSSAETDNCNARWWFVITLAWILFASTTIIDEAMRHEWNNVISIESYKCVHLRAALIRKCEHCYIFFFCCLRLYNN